VHWIGKESPVHVDLPIAIAVDPLQGRAYASGVTWSRRTIARWCSKGRDDPAAEDGSR
jgi:hypothetical protein